MHPGYLLSMNPSQGLVVQRQHRPKLYPPPSISHSRNTASKAVTSKSLNTRCKVATQGVFPGLNPRSCLVATPWSRSHWAIAYKLRAPHNIAQTAKVSIDPRG